MARNIVDPSLPNIYLKPGELYLCKTPALVSTVLGSCVSITIFSPEAKIGSMCHAMLPRTQVDPDFRFVDTVLRHMYKSLVMICGKSSGFEAKLFGGADVLLGSPAERSVGAQNVEAALQVLGELGLPLAASDTGGTRGRKLFFYTGTGKVYLRKLRRTIRTQQS